MCECKHIHKHACRAAASVTMCSSSLEALTGAHAVALLTNWPEFASLDWSLALRKMQQPAFVFDGRNMLEHEQLRQLGFIVYALGKPLDPFFACS